jgi:hypothetical protein
LLVLGTEYPELDFKRVIDLGEKRQEVELARDVGGMLVRGGYILAGIGPDARPTGDMDGMDLALFDDARLVPKLRTWLPEPLNLVTRVTERGGHKVVLIYVERSPVGVVFMRADGAYPKGSDTAFRFRKGDALAERLPHGAVERARPRGDHSATDRGRQGRVDGRVLRHVCPRIVFEAGWVMEVEAHIVPATAKGQMRSRKDRPSSCSPEGA